MYYRKLTCAQLLMLYASVYFGSVEGAGFRLRDAKTAVRGFLTYLLPTIGFPGVNVSGFINRAGNVDDLINIANSFIQDPQMNALQTITPTGTLTNKSLFEAIADQYTMYENSFVQLLEEDPETVNKAIPFASKLVFDLDSARLQVKECLEFLFELLRIVDVDFTTIDEADTLEEMTGIADDFITAQQIQDLQEIASSNLEDEDDTRPADMRKEFDQYKASIIGLLNQDPVTRGRKFPLHGKICHS